MASQNSSAKAEGLEHQDQSIKARKTQLFEDRDRADAEGPVVQPPFREFVRRTPPAPLSAGVKASLWAVGVVVVLLFVAAMFSGGSKPKKRHASLPPARPAASAVLPS